MVDLTHFVQKNFQKNFRPSVRPAKFTHINFFYTWTYTVKKVEIDDYKRGFIVSDSDFINEESKTIIYSIVNQNFSAWKNIEDLPKSKEESDFDKEDEEISPNFNKQFANICMPHALSWFLSIITVYVEPILYSFLPTLILIIATIVIISNFSMKTFKPRREISTGIDQINKKSLTQIDILIYLMGNIILLSGLPSYAIRMNAIIFQIDDYLLINRLAKLFAFIANARIIVKYFFILLIFRKIRRTIQLDSEIRVQLINQTSDRNHCNEIHSSQAKEIHLEIFTNPRSMSFV